DAARDAQVAGLAPSARWMSCPICSAAGPAETASSQVRRRRRTRSWAERSPCAADRSLTPGIGVSEAPGPLVVPVEYRGGRKVAGSNPAAPTRWLIPNCRRAARRQHEGRRSRRCYSNVDPEATMHAQLDDLLTAAYVLVDDFLP